MKAAFTPVSILVGLLAGQVAKRIFTFAWGQIDDNEAPQPKHRDIQLAQLAIALTVEGAIFKLVKGLTDHGLRHAFARSTGEWPGEEKPDS